GQTALQQPLPSVSGSEVASAGELVCATTWTWPLLGSTTGSIPKTKDHPAWAVTDDPPCVVVVWPWQTSVTFNVQVTSVWPGRRWMFTCTRTLHLAPGWQFPCGVSWKPVTAPVGACCWGAAVAGGAVAAGRPCRPRAPRRAGPW